MSRLQGIAHFVIALSARLSKRLLIDGSQWSATGPLLSLSVGNFAIDAVRRHPDPFAIPPGHSCALSL
jgi:hypothetical protein